MLAPNGGSHGGGGGGGVGVGASSPRSATHAGSPSGASPSSSRGGASLEAPLLRDFGAKGGAAIDEDSPRFGSAAAELDDAELGGSAGAATGDASGAGANASGGGSGSGDGTTRAGGLSESFSSSGVWPFTDPDEEDLAPLYSSLIGQADFVRAHALYERESSKGRLSGGGAPREESLPFMPGPQVPAADRRAAARNVSRGQSAALSLREISTRTAHEVAVPVGRGDSVAILRGANAGVGRGSTQWPSTSTLAVPGGRSRRDSTMALIHDDVGLMPRGGKADPLTMFLRVARCFGAYIGSSKYRTVLIMYSWAITCLVGICLTVDVVSMATTVGPLRILVGSKTDPNGYAWWTRTSVISFNLMPVVASRFTTNFFDSVIFKELAARHALRGSNKKSPVSVLARRFCYGTVAYAVGMGIAVWLVELLTDTYRDQVFYWALLLVINVFWLAQVNIAVSAFCIACTFLEHESQLVMEDAKHHRPPPAVLVAKLHQFFAMVRQMSRQWRAFWIVATLLMVLATVPTVYLLLSGNTVVWWPAVLCFQTVSATLYGLWKAGRVTSACERLIRCLWLLQEMPGQYRPDVPAARMNLVIQHVVATQHIGISFCECWKVLGDVV